MCDRYSVWKLILNWFNVTSVYDIIIGVKFMCAWRGLLEIGIKIWI
jgi:hypothetical protein